MSFNVQEQSHKSPAGDVAPWLVSNKEASSDPDMCRWPTFGSYFKPQIPNYEQNWTKIGVNPDKDDKPDWRGIRRDQIREWPMPKPIECKPTTSMEYYWFDTPDYADPFRKLLFLAKSSFKLALVALPLGHMWEGCQEPLIKVYPKYLLRYSLPSFTIPMFLGTSVICIANLRNKADDNWNYFYAGMATAIFIGYRYNNWTSWWRALIYGVPPVVLMKEVHERNNVFFTRPSQKIRIMAGLYGFSADRGISSGDWRFGFRDAQHDPGRRPY